MTLRATHTRPDADPDEGAIGIEALARAHKTLVRERTRHRGPAHHHPDRRRAAPGTPAHLSRPGLGPVLAARILDGSVNDPTRSTGAVGCRTARGAVWWFRAVVSWWARAPGVPARTAQASRACTALLLHDARVTGLVPA